MGKISELATNIGQARLNPSLVQDQVYDAIEAATDGEIDIVDPSTPFSILMGAGTALHIAGMSEMGSSVRQQYSQFAQTYDDLYYHMAGVDYLDRFCTPAKAPFTFCMSKAELLQRMLDVPGTRIKQLLIPRNTQWLVNDHTFTLLYPVVIRLMPAGGLEITYSNSQVSPIEALETNIVDWYSFTQDGLEYIALTLPTHQFTITSYNVPVLSSSSNAVEYDIESGSSYYYCRVWRKISDGSWLECQTTHCPLVYNANVPTAVLKVTDNKLKVSIPQIYLTNGKMGNSLRIDVYTSRGAINIDLSGYAPSNFVRTSNDPQAVADELTYSAPLEAFNDCFSFCDKKIIGGANGLSFEQLLDRVIHNANTTDFPITDAQLETALERQNFGILKSIEDINSRTYLATRALPAPESDKFTTGIACSMESFQTTIDALVGYSTVADNGERVTIKPETLFLMDDDSLRIVSDQEKANLATLTPDVLANLVNNSQYLFTPYHYVLDTENDAFYTRPYYLENPRVDYRRFIDANETTLLEVAPDTITVAKTATGYRLTVSSKSGDSWKALADNRVFCQLAFQPEGDTGWAFMNGALLPSKLNGERVYQFDIETNWDITPTDGLVVDNFAIFNNAGRRLSMPLSGTWDIVYVVGDYDVYLLEKRKMDLWMGLMLLPSNSSAVSRHRIGMTLGDALSFSTDQGTKTGLWTRARNVAGSERYAVWSADVGAVWESDVPKRVDGKPVIKVVNGKVTYEWEHRKGDPVIDETTGKQKIAHRAGEAKLDADNKPIKILDRQTERQFDIFMLDGVYYFATDAEDVEYVKEIPKNVVDWVYDTIKPMAAKLIENSNLLFYPTRSLGYSRVVVNDGRAVSIPAGLQFHITYSMSLVGYSNLELRDALETMSSKIINSVLSRNTVSISDIIVRLAAVAGTDVIGVKVDDLGPNKDISTYTALDESIRCGVRRKLEVMPEEILRVEEDISYDFINHNLRTINQA